MSHSRTKVGNISEMMILKHFVVPESEEVLKAKLKNRTLVRVSQRNKECSMEGEKWIMSQWKNLTKTRSSRWSRPASTIKSHVDSIYVWYDIVKMALTPVGIPLNNSYSLSYHEKNIKHISIFRHLDC